MTQGPWMRDVTGEGTHTFLGADASSPASPTNPVPVQVVKSSGLISGAIIGAAAAYLVPLAFDWFFRGPDQPEYVDFDVSDEP